MSLSVLSQFAASCPEHTFFGLPTWYHYLNMNGKMQYVSGRCEFVTLQGGLAPIDFALIGVAALDIVLRIAGMVALGYVIYGGVQYVTSQGEPDQAKRARQTIINALIGTGIALMATGFVSFLGARLA